MADGRRVCERLSGGDDAQERRALEQRNQRGDGEIDPQEVAMETEEKFHEREEGMKRRKSEPKCEATGSLSCNRTRCRRRRGRP